MSMRRKQLEVSSSEAIQASSGRTQFAAQEASSSSTYSRAKNLSAVHKGHAFNLAQVTHRSEINPELKSPRAPFPVLIDVNAPYENVCSEGGDIHLRDRLGRLEGLLRVLRDA